MILQLSLCAPERVIDRKIKIGMPLVRLAAADGEGLHPGPDDPGGHGWNRRADREHTLWTDNAADQDAVDIIESVAACL